MREAGVTMRLITSENLIYARAVAMQAGIISKEMALEPHVCMEGHEFMR